MYIYKILKSINQVIPKSYRCFGLSFYHEVNYYLFPIRVLNGFPVPYYHGMNFNAFKKNVVSGVLLEFFQSLKLQMPYTLFSVRQAGILPLVASDSI
jgi:hypothetical protein